MMSSLVKTAQRTRTASSEVGSRIPTLDGSQATERLHALLSATTIFLSAFLLFSLEPLLAKRILPWFGGSAAVWSTCLVFYQVALLIGYLYARILTKRLPGRVQPVIHIALLLG